MSSHDQIAHRWAHRVPNYDAKRLQGYAMFAQGDTLYSWGHHFPIARHVLTTPAKGAARHVVLFNADDYSSSTGKHKSIAWRALDYGRLRPCYRLPQEFWPIHGNTRDVTAKQRRDANKRTAQAALQWYAQQALNSLEAATRARVYAQQHMERANAYLDTAERFAADFGVKWVRPDVDALRARAAAAAAKRAREAAKARKRAAEAAEERRKAAADDFAAWRRGERHAAPAEWRVSPDGAAYIRRNGDMLQTSQGASVPWDHAVKAFRFIKLCRERGEQWETNGRVIRVGHFQIDCITAQGDMRAGCHFFKWEEIERLARAESVFDAPPSAEAVEYRERA